jgi:hypothetical protein
MSRGGIGYGADGEAEPAAARTRVREGELGEVRRREVGGVPLRAKRPVINGAR